jgi:hypothetical protein
MKFYIAVEQFSPLLDEMRKTSLSGILNETSNGLTNSFAAATPSAEDLIFNMFKVTSFNIGLYVKHLY